MPPRKAARPRPAVAPGPRPAKGGSGRARTGGRSRATGDGATTTADAEAAPAAAGGDGATPRGRPGTPAQGRELRARGQRTMQRLLDAGIDVFATRGYHSARVDDIVKAARTSHGTFYLYFANKEDLFAALVADVADELAGLTGALGPVTPDRAGRDELRTWLGRFTDMYQHYGPVIRTWTEAEVAGDEAGRVGTDVLGELGTGLGRRIAESSGTGLDPTIAGLALVAMIERFHYIVLSGQVQADRDELLDTLADATHAALFGAAAARA